MTVPQWLARMPRNSQNSFLCFIFIVFLLLNTVLALGIINEADLNIQKKILQPERGSTIKSIYYSCRGPV